MGYGAVESWVVESLIVIKTSWVKTLAHGLLVVSGSGIVYSRNARLPVKWPRYPMCRKGISHPAAVPVSPLPALH